VSFSFVFRVSMLAGSLGFGVPSFAAAPSLKSVFPAGGQRGGTVEILLDGKAEKGKVWIEGGGVTFTAPDDKGKVQATLAADATPGLRLLRVFNAEGVSEAVRFVVGTVPEVVEMQPNHAPLQAMPLDKLPVCVNGRIDKAGDIDHFSFLLKKGQQVRIDLLAYTLGSPIDPLLHVLDEKGTRVATASDGRNLDPALTFTAPAEGRYTVQIAGFAHPPASEVSFTGGSSVVYRLTVHQGPLTTGVFPAAVSSKTSTRLTRRGIGLAKDQPLHEMPATELTAQGRLMQMAVPDCLLPLDGLVTPASPSTEAEPNDTPDKATSAASLPAGFTSAVTWIGLFFRSEKARSCARRFLLTGWAYPWMRRSRRSMREERIWGCLKIKRIWLTRRSTGPPLRTACIRLWWRINFIAGERPMSMCLKWPRSLPPLKPHLLTESR
jgi:hypothetical protein